MQNSLANGNSAVYDHGADIAALAMSSDLDNVSSFQDKQAKDLIVFFVLVSRPFAFLSHRSKEI